MKIKPCTFRLTLLSALLFINSCTLPQGVTKSSLFPTVWSSSDEKLIFSLLIENKSAPSVPIIADGRSADLKKSAVQMYEYDAITNETRKLVELPVFPKRDSLNVVGWVGAQKLLLREWTRTQGNKYFTLRLDSHEVAEAPRLREFHEIIGVQFNAENDKIVICHWKSRPPLALSNKVIFTNETVLDRNYEVISTNPTRCFGSRFQMYGGTSSHIFPSPVNSRRVALLIDSNVYALGMGSDLCPGGPQTLAVLINNNSSNHAVSNQFSLWKFKSTKDLENTLSSLPGIDDVKIIARAGCSASPVLSLRQIDVPDNPLPLTVKQ